MVKEVMLTCYLFFFNFVQMQILLNMKTIISILSILVFTVSGQSQSLTVKEIINNNIKSGVETKTISAEGIILYAQDILPVFYETNNFAPAWNTEQNRVDLIRSLEDSYNEGLLPEDYHLEKIKLLISEIKSNADPNKVANLDLLMTDAVMLYATNLIIGKVDQSKIVEGWDVPPNVLPKNDGILLNEVLTSYDITEALNTLKPDNFMYVHLRNGLANYREIAKNGGWPDIPPGQVLKLDVSDERVLLLRKYLTITGDMPTVTNSINDSIYDKDVENAVKQFQHRHNLNQDGVVGKGTLSMINIPVEQRIDELRINMERARWIIHHLPKDFMVVNIAGYNVRRITNDSVVFYSRVIVGRHFHETPIFKGKLSYIELNPTWTLPYSIATKETLPKLQKNPNYLAEKNMIIMDRNGKELDPSTIDFNSLSRNNFPYTFRQKAGPHNALGQVKFIFPNSYSVYLHDTPARSLFSHEERAFSHGCIRLDKKWELFMNLMDDHEVWNMKKINEILASGKTTRVNLKNPIEIILLYWTAGADKQDVLYFNKDIYDRDPDVLKELDKPYKHKKVE